MAVQAQEEFAPQLVGLLRVGVQPPLFPPAGLIGYVAVVALVTGLPVRGGDALGALAHGNGPPKKDSTHRVPSEVVWSDWIVWARTKLRTNRAFDRRLAMLNAYGQVTSGEDKGKTLLYPKQAR